MQIVPLKRKRDSSFIGHPKPSAGIFAAENYDAKTRLKFTAAQRNRAGRGND
jgi:hypothetical protein